MNSKAVLLVVSVFLLALMPRVTQLGQILSPDEPQWQRNTEEFKEGLVSGNLSKLYQQPHPGITTMWVSFPTAESESWAARRAPMAIVTSLLIVAAAYAMFRLWGLVAGVSGGLLLALNPLLIAHSRVLAMDALLGLFLLLGLLFLLLWLEEKQRWWLALSAATAALAVLSKMAGLVIVPFIGLVLTLTWWRQPAAWRQVRQEATLWAASFAVTFIVFFPTIITDFATVWAGTREFFATEHFQQAVHALGPWWYPEALLLWSTPMHWAGLLILVALPFLPARTRRHLFLLAAFFALFFVAMQYSIKKGDRYLLPVFLVWDVAAAMLFASLLHMNTHKFPIRPIVLSLLLIAFVWQTVDVIRLHPYALAYRNPFFRSFAQGRTMGWGEGLDLAADYLNAKPNAEEMLVISYYESSFDHRFRGPVTSAERLAKETPEQIGGQYVVLYRTMEGRAPDRWETNVLQQFADKQPEHIVILNGEEYAWIYATTPTAPTTSEEP